MTTKAKRQPSSKRFPPRNARSEGGRDGGLEKRVSTAARQGARRGASKAIRGNRT